MPLDLDDRELSRAAATVARTGSIAFVRPDGVTRYRAAAEGIVTDDGDDAATVVELSTEAWNDLVAQRRTFINLFLGDELSFPVGSFERLADWDPALKLLHAGIPIYDPARADLGDFDPAHTYTPADDDDTMRAHLGAVGFLHVRSVFSAGEMAGLNAEVDRVAADRRPGDGDSWWVTDADGTERLCRLVYAGRHSDLIRGFDDDPRVRRFGTLADPALRPAPDRMEGTSVLLKVPGETSGLSNIPWHQDCGMGGHSIFCPAAAVGIQITGSSAATGNFAAVPGSHGQTLHYRWQEQGVDVPIVQVDTEPGDITVHIQDLMHASPPPTGEGWRRTMYITHYPPALFEHIGPGQAFNDLIRDRQDDAARLQ